MPAGSRAGVITYLVRLASPPVAAYGGQIAGYAATSPKVTGRRLDLASRQARSYRSYLDGQETRVLARLRPAGAPVLHRYRTAFPGFAARLTSDQAALLRADPEVARVVPDRVGRPTQEAAVPSVIPSVIPARGIPERARIGKGRAPGSRAGGANGPDLVNGPGVINEAELNPAEAAGSGETIDGDGAAFLGLPDGLWDRLGGPEKAGAGVIVGVIDTGIFPEHPSFADRPEAAGHRNYLGPPYDPPKLWKGACQAGEGFSSSACNNKLIGARYFVAGFDADNLHPSEFLSPRDADGHGSHVAATAVGNFGVDPVVAGSDLGIDRISGIAPRAYIAAYKVCWTGREDPGNEAPTGCNESDSIAAVDAAVSDGVDIINFSVGGASPAAIGPLEMAFLFAADAGVFVVGAAGNAGPHASTVGSPAAVPWVTSVAASTLARTFEAAARVGDAGETKVAVKGASLTGNLPETPILDASALPAAGVSGESSALCLPGSLNPPEVAGKAVLCRRGNNPRIEKSKAVADAGGVGMVLYNAESNEDIVAEAHWVPSVHVSAADGAAIKAAMARIRRPVVEISGAAAAPSKGDVVAAFSARGPQQAVPDIPKPDVSAPGVKVLAAASPTPADPSVKPGEIFQVMSGTSMASPHVAGAAALLTDLHPDFSPAALKSALMTTANPQMRRDDGTAPAGPFDMGSGRIDPNRAADPGLVLEAGLPDYQGYLEGIDPTVVEGDVKPIAPADLNMPAISFGALAGVSATTRTLRSVDPTLSSWEVTLDGLKGVEAEVSPQVITIGPGQSQTIRFRFTHAGGAFDRYSLGAVVLTNSQDGRKVTLPITIEPVKLAIGRVITIPAADPSGSAPIPIKSGVAGEVSGFGWGLAAPQTFLDQRVRSTSGMPTPSPDPGVKVYDVTVPDGSQLIAGQLANVDAGDPATDLDLYLYRDAAGDGFNDGDLVDQSASGQASESLVALLPEAGRYRFVVVGFKTRDPSSTYEFRSWLVADPSPDDASNHPGITVAGDPLVVQPGQEGALRLNWSELTGDGVYLGLATFYDSTPGMAAPVAASVVQIIKGPGRAAVREADVRREPSGPPKAPPQRLQGGAE